MANIENVVPATCFFGYDGSVELSVMGGQPYTLDFENNNPTALAPGDYEVTITDDNLCSTTLEYTISSPPALQITLDSQQPECSDLNSGMIFYDAAGGSGELTFDFEGNDPNALPAVTITLLLLTKMDAHSQK